MKEKKKTTSAKSWSRSKGHLTVVNHEDTRLHDINDNTVQDRAFQVQMYRKPPPSYERH